MPRASMPGTMKLQCDCWAEQVNDKTTTAHWRQAATLRTIFVSLAYIRQITLWDRNIFTG